MRPGMYIGSTSKEGLHHWYGKLYDNSIDEALAGFATHIEVFIEKMIRLQLLMMGVVFLLIFKKKQVVPPLKQSLRFCTLEVNSAVAATRFQVVYMV